MYAVLCEMLQMEEVITFQVSTQHKNALKRLLAYKPERYLCNGSSSSFLFAESNVKTDNSRLYNFPQNHVIFSIIIMKVMTLFWDNFSFYFGIKLV